MTTARTFPIQFERGAAAHPREVPWSVAERAYSAYASKWGQGQTIERLAERGGFAPSEMDMFLPGWREEVSEIARLSAALDAALGVVEEQCDRIDNLLAMSKMPLPPRLHLDGILPNLTEIAARLRALTEEAR